VRRRPRTQKHTDSVGTLHATWPAVPGTVGDPSRQDPISREAARRRFACENYTVPCYATPTHWDEYGGQAQDQAQGTSMQGERVGVAPFWRPPTSFSAQPACDLFMTIILSCCMPSPPPHSIANILILQFGTFTLEHVCTESMVLWSSAPTHIHPHVLIGIGRRTRTSVSHW
jgi:hypothetical protein